MHTDEILPASGCSALVGFAPKMVRGVEFYTSVVTSSKDVLIRRVRLTKSKTQDLGRPDLYFAHFLEDLDRGKKDWLQQNLVYRDLQTCSGVFQRLHEEAQAAKKGS